MDNEKEINRLASKHIGKLLTRLAVRYNLPDDIQNAVKAQFRMFQDDVLDVIKEGKNGTISSNSTLD